MADLTVSADVDSFMAAANAAAMRSVLGLDLSSLTLTGLLTITQGTANAGILASTGYSLTGSDATSMIDLAGTWNTTGTPTAIKLNITNTASNAASLLMDLQVGGVSKLSSRVDGYFTAGTGALGAVWTLRGAVDCVFTQVGGGGIQANQDWRTTGTIYSDNTSAALVLFESRFGRAAADVFQCGTDHATTPTAQTLVSHSVTTGTGANMILGAGTGSVAGGAVILATRATTGALVNRLTVAASGAVTVAGTLTVGTGTFQDYGSGQIGLGNHYFSANGIFANASLRVNTGGLGGGFRATISPNSAANFILELREGDSAHKFRVFGAETGSKYAQLEHDGTNAKLNSSSGDLHISSLPTSNPGAGILWNNAGTPAIGT